MQTFESTTVIRVSSVNFRGPTVQRERIGHGLTRMKHGRGERCADEIRDQGCLAVRPLREQGPTAMRRTGQIKAYDGRPRPALLEAFHTDGRGRPSYDMFDSGP